MRWHTAIASYWAAGIFVIAFHCGFGDTGGHRCDYSPKWEIHQRKKKELHAAENATWSSFIIDHPRKFL
jgi:hypothetical protein